MADRSASSSPGGKRTPRRAATADEGLLQFRNSTVSRASSRSRRGEIASGSLRGGDPAYASARASAATDDSSSSTTDQAFKRTSTSKISQRFKRTNTKSTMSSTNTAASGGANNGSGGSSGGGDKDKKKSSSSSSSNSDKIKDFMNKFQAAEGGSLLATDTATARGRSRRTGILSATEEENDGPHKRSSSASGASRRRDRSRDRSRDTSTSRRGRSERDTGGGGRSRSRSRAGKKKERRSSSVDALSKGGRRAPVALADLKKLHANKHQPPKPNANASNHVPKAYLERGNSDASANLNLVEAADTGASTNKSATTRMDESQKSAGGDAFDFDAPMRTPAKESGLLGSLRSNASTGSSTSNDTKKKEGTGNIFSTRQDLREVDQSVNLMDAESGNYQSSRRSTASTATEGRSGRRKPRKSILQAMFGGNVNARDSAAEESMKNIDLGPDPTKRRMTHFYLQQQAARRDNPWGRCKETMTPLWKFLRRTICSAPFLTMIVIIVTLVFWIPFLQDKVNSMPAPAPEPVVTTPQPTKAPETPEPTQAPKTPEPTKAPETTPEPTPAKPQEEEVAVADKSAPQSEQGTTTNKPPPPGQEGEQVKSVWTTMMDVITGNDDGNNEPKQKSNFGQTSKTGGDDQSTTRSHSSFGRADNPNKKKNKTDYNISEVELDYVDRYYALHDLVLENNLTDPMVLDDPDSSQYKALHWMIIASDLGGGIGGGGGRDEDTTRRLEEDDSTRSQGGMANSGTRRLDSGSNGQGNGRGGEMTDAHAIERYVAAVLFFSTHNLTDTELWNLLIGIDGWTIGNSSSDASTRTVHDAIDYWNKSDIYDHWNDTSGDSGDSGDGGDSGDSGDGSHSNSSSTDERPSNSSSTDERPSNSSSTDERPSNSSSTDERPSNSSSTDEAPNVTPRTAGGGGGPPNKPPKPDGQNGGPPHPPPGLNGTLPGNGTNPWPPGNSTGGPGHGNGTSAGNGTHPSGSPPPKGKAKKRTAGGLSSPKPPAAQPSISSSPSDVPSVIPSAAPSESSAPSSTPPHTAPPVHVHSLSTRLSSQNQNTPQHLRHLGKGPSNGKGPKGKGNWLVSGNICKWKGIECDDDDLVTEIDLSNHGLSGTIPTEMRGFEQLVELDLSGNSFYGPIPSELGSLANLEKLALQENTLSGAIPAALADAPLEALYLDHNHLGSRIPTSLGKLENMTELYLSHNHLHGKIPAELETGLLKIKKLHLQINKLTGPVPAFASNYEDLETLRLHHNSLTGTISDSLCLAVSDNSLRYLTADCSDGGPVSCVCCHKCY